MTVYQTDYDGRYVDAIQLGKGDICPKTGVYLIPGGCVTAEPPEVPGGKGLFWQKDESMPQGEWVLIDKPLEGEKE